MLHTIRMKLRVTIRIWLNSLKVALHYLRWPYHIQRKYEFDGFNHEHVCLATRLTQADLSEICPHTPKSDIGLACTDPCELCKYFGTIMYELDPETNEKQIRIIGDDRFIASIDTQNLRRNLTR